jgi:hypothetical protein
VTRHWKPLFGKWLYPAVLCGRHSLPLFCIGVFLSFAAHWILTQYTKGVLEQLSVSLLGIAIMIAIAWVLDRAREVPDLFVQVLETEQQEPAAAVAMMPAVEAVKA